VLSAHDSWKSLSDLAELIEPEARSRQGFIDECKSGKLDGVLVIYRTFNSIDITGKFDEELVPVLPDSLKFICHNGRLVCATVSNYLDHSVLSSMSISI
jgi:glyoxylate reductase